jgi:hypothetical protein
MINYPHIHPGITSFSNAVVGISSQKISQNLPTQNTTALNLTQPQANNCTIDRAEVSMVKNLLQSKPGA